MKTAEEMYMHVQDQEHPNVNNLTLAEEWQLKAMEEYADQFKPKWISVKDALPNNFEAVLIWADYIGTGHMAEINTIGTWQKDHWNTDRDNDYDKVEIHVTHWMPLPNRPQP